MTEQSTPSPPASEETIRDSSKAALGAASARIHQRLNEESQPQPIGESTLKTIARCQGWRKRLETHPVGLYERADVPRRHTRLIDDAQSPTEWRDTRDRIAAKLRTGFLIALVGKRGPGKTQIGQQLILTNTACGRTARYTRAMSIFLDLRATFRNAKASEEYEPDSEGDIIDLYRRPSLLVVDEMQERGETPWEDHMLNHLIDLRYGDVTDTLLIANLTPDAFKKSVGESISDRLRETGGIVECQWDSFRGRGLSEIPTLRRKEYEDYLKTDTWKRLRTQAIREAKALCRSCGRPGTVVHHTRYPKQLGTETMDMLEVLCETCHRNHHGLAVTT